MLSSFPKTLNKTLCRLPCPHSFWLYGQVVIHIIILYILYYGQVVIYKWSLYRRTCHCNWWVKGYIWSPIQLNSKSDKQQLTVCCLPDYTNFSSQVAEVVSQAFKCSQVVVSTHHTGDLVPGSSHLSFSSSPVESNCSLQKTLCL